MNKRAIAILGAIFILIVGTLGFLIYSRSKSNSNTNTQANVNINTPVVESPPVNDNANTNTPPTAPAAAAVRLSDTADQVISPILFFQGNGISYFNPEGHLFQTDLQITNGSALLSNKRELSIALKPNISKVLWPVVGNNFIAQFDSGSKSSWSVYQSEKADYVDIPSQVYSIDWMPTGDKIMYVWVDANGKATLNISNPDTSNYQTLTDLYDSDTIINVSPDGKNVLFYRAQTTDNTKNVINMVSADGKTFTGIVKDGYNTGVLWSPDSKKFLFTKRDNSNQKFGLWVADITTGEIKNLALYTSQTKAVWSKDSQFVYAGVPTTGTVGQGLTQDNIEKITIATAQSQVFTTGVAVDAQNLFLSTDESVLFFKNAQDNALYYISVK